MRWLLACLLLAALPSAASFINYESREINVKLVFVWKTTPITVQVQAEAVEQPMTTEAVSLALGLSGQPIFSATPKSGVGVFDTLKASAKQVLMELKKGAPDAGPRATGNAHHLAPP